MANVDFLQAILFSDCFLMGLLLVLPLLNNQKLSLLIMFSSFPLGCGFVSLLTTAHIMSSLTYPITYDLLLANLIVFGFAIKKLKNLKANGFRILSGISVFFLVITLATTVFPYISLSYDSIRQILFAYKLGLTGSSNGIDWASWGPVFLAIHSLASVINENYLSTFLLAFIFCFLGVFFISIYLSLIHI